MEEVKKVNAPHKKWLILMIVGLALCVVFGILAGVLDTIKEERVNDAGETLKILIVVCIALAVLSEAFAVFCMHKLIRVWKVERVVNGQAQPKIVVPQPEKAKPWKIMTFVFAGLHLVTLIVLAILFLGDGSSPDEALMFVLVVVHVIALVMAILSGHKFILKARVVKTVSTAENK